MTPIGPTRPFNRVITGFFDRAAVAYDFPMVQWAMYRSPHDDVVAVLRSAAARAIADIGCGTGILTVRIAEQLRPDRIYGVDMSEGMLAKARARSSAVQWLHEPAERTSFEDASLDAVVTTTAFHFFDQPAALAEFRRIVRPGGLVVISAVNPRSTVAHSLQLLSGGRFGPSDAASPARMRAMIASAGLELVDQRPISRPLPEPLIPDLLTIARRPE